jgi:hypothetical protein
MTQANRLTALSLAVVLAGGTALAQATSEEVPTTDQATGTPTAQGDATDTQGSDMQTAQEGDADGEMPQAATPEGTGLSDLADVDTPEGTVGATQGDQQQGRTVMLDIEGFTEAIYERGFRQGYIRGIADARDRFAAEMQRIHDGERMGMTGRMQGQHDPQQRRPQGQMGEGTANQQAQQDMQDWQGRPDRRSGGGERGTIIVLPPGLSPEAFIDQLMQANEDAMSDG